MNNFLTENKIFTEEKITAYINNKYWKNKNKKISYHQNYTIIDKTIIFDYEFFSEDLTNYIDVINGCEILIFPNYTNLLFAYITKNHYHEKSYNYDYREKKFDNFDYQIFHNEYFDGIFNEPVNNLSKKITNLKELYFNTNFNKPLGDFLCYSINLKHLAFGNKFNQPLNKSLNNLQNLTHLTFGGMFNQPLNETLKNLHNLTHLTFGSMFNQSLDLPANLTHLIFGDSFNQLLDLPENLTHLIFGVDFNQSLNLPLNLTHLTLGEKFNQSLDILLNNSNNLLYVNIDNNLPVNNILSKLNNLETLILGKNFNQHIVIPFNIKKLTINFFDNFHIVDYLPNSIEELTICEAFEGTLNNLPTSIKKLYFTDGYYKDLNNLPDSIEHIEIPRSYYDIINFPKNLVSIKCDEFFIHKYYTEIQKFKKINIKILPKLY